jgi:hypothetical protein
MRRSPEVRRHAVLARTCSMMRVTIAGLRCTAPGQVLGVGVTAHPASTELARHEERGAGLLSIDDRVDRSHSLGPEVAPSILPLVVMLGEDHAHEANDRGSIGEDVHDGCRRLISLLSRSRGFVERIWRPSQGRQSGRGDRARRRRGAARRRGSGRWRVDDVPQLLMSRSFVAHGTRMATRAAMLTTRWFSRTFT